VRGVDPHVLEFALYVLVCCECVRGVDPHVLEFGVVRVGVL
jgi:hypothetical protein